MIQNYQQIAERVAKHSGKTIEDINRLVEAKRAKLSGLISREGAAQIVASELGINFDKEKIKINEISTGMKKVNVVGKIIRMFPVREYKKENREGKVSNFIIADDTGNIKVVLWDVNHIALVENSSILEGDFIEISNANLRNNELHLTGFSDIKKSNETIDNIKTGRDYAEKKISDFGIGGSFRTRAIVVQVFEPRSFEVCPECGDKLIGDVDGARCEKHGRVTAKKRFLLSLVLDDGTSSIRAILFSEQIEKMGFSSESLEPGIFIEKRKNLLGKEAWFSGNVRQNRLFNNPEYFISDIEDIEIEKLIELLEK